MGYGVVLKKRHIGYGVLKKVMKIIGGGGGRGGLHEKKIIGGGGGV